MIERRKRDRNVPLGDKIFEIFFLIVLHCIDSFLAKIENFGKKKIKTRCYRKQEKFELNPKFKTY